MKKSGSRPQKPSVARDEDGRTPEEAAEAKELAQWLAQMMREGVIKETPSSMFRLKDTGEPGSEPSKPQRKRRRSKKITGPGTPPES